MARKSSEKILLSAKDSVPPPGYTGRDNACFESEEGYRNETTRHHDGKRGKNKKIESICLCTASVYPHYHGETIIDGSVYDEILILDTKELQQTANKNVRFKGQCLRICKLFATTFIVIVGLTCGLYGLTHFFLSNKAKDALMTKGDVKLLQYSTYFCEHVKTEASEIDRSMVVLKRKIGEATSFTYNMTKEIQLKTGQSIYEQPFYAIEQGVLYITIEAKEDVNVLIFDKKDRLAAWKSNRNYAFYNWKQTCCKSATKKRGLYQFRTEQDTQAFLVIYSDVNTNASLTIRNERTFFDYKRAGELCMASKEETCSVPMAFSSNDKVVVEIPGSSSVTGSKKVEWNCEARIWFYVVLFAGIFLIFVFLVLICYCLLKYCFCDPCCCCYIVPRDNDKPKVVQYHRSNSNLARTPKGPRAEHMRTSNESNINNRYIASDTSDTESRVISKRRQLTRTDSEATTQSGASVQFCRRRSSSIGSDLKRGMFVDERYEELPDEKENGFIVIDMGSEKSDGYVIAKKKRKGQESGRKYGTSERLKSSDSNEGYMSDTEMRLQRKRAQFSDSEEEQPESESDDYDNTYDVVGLQLPDASKSTAEKIDSLPLGPSGAPPRAPPKSAASLKGKPGLKGVKSLENLEFLPNGMTRVHGEKLHKSKSDVTVKKERRPSPITPKVIVLNTSERKRSEIYGTYDRAKKPHSEANGLCNRTISLDSGLDNFDGRMRPAADVRF